MKDLAKTNEIENNPSPFISKESDLIHNDGGLAKERNRLYCDSSQMVEFNSNPNYPAPA